MEFFAYRTQLFFASPIKHRIGTKRHKVCLELPQEMNENATVLKEGDDVNPVPQNECEETKGKQQKEEACCKFNAGDASLNDPGKICCLKTQFYILSPELCVLDGNHAFFPL